MRRQAADGGNVESRELRRRRAAGRWQVLCLGLVLSTLVGMVLAGCQTGARTPSGPAINIGLIAPLSGSTGPNGESIQRGMLLAIDEVNRSGGVLGRPLAVVARDVGNDPTAGVTALRELAADHRIVAVFGGLYSSVIVPQLDLVHQQQIPLITAWATPTAITRNGREPNYAFRISISDERAQEFMARYAVEVVGASRPGIMAAGGAGASWGEPNVVGLTERLTRLGTPPVAVERFDFGSTDMSAQVGRLRAAGVDTVMMIAGAPESAAIARAMGALVWRPTIINHGAGAGPFAEMAGSDNAEGVLTLQTFSFHGTRSPRSEAVLQAYYARFGARRVEDVAVPAGVANGYDGVHLLTRAIRQAGTTEGARVREALEQAEPYDGLIKRYDPPFTVERHDALLADDYLMMVWRDGQIVPSTRPRLAQ